MNILEQQNEILAKGWVWTETLYNDEYYRNCIIELTQSKDINAFSKYPRPGDCIGWGRFTREECWDMAYSWIVNNKPLRIF